MIKPLFWTLALVALLGCGDDASTVQDNQAASDQTSSGTPTTDQTTTTETNPCVFPLVRLQTGQDSSCAGGNEHLWPVGMPEGACHGWQGVDNEGGTHDNSASAIKCNADGTFEFTQYAGNLTCQGDGVRKVYELGVCEQDIPPRLYTIATDLTCCLEPDSPDCMRGVPSVGVEGGLITLNGEECSAE